MLPTCVFIGSAELGQGVGAERQRFIPYKKRFLNGIKRFYVSFFAEKNCFFASRAKLFRLSAFFRLFPVGPEFPPFPSCVKWNLASTRRILVQRKNEGQRKTNSGKRSENKVYVAARSFLAESSQLKH